MSSFTPFDVALGAVYLLRRFGLGRTLLLTAILTPVYLWSLPPVSCSCLGPVFRRCDNSRFYEVVLKSDLKNLASQQEIYFSDSGAYSDDPAALAFTHSAGVTFEISADRDSWYATASHAALDGERSCAMYGGSRPALHPLLVDAKPFELVCGG